MTLSAVGNSTRSTRVSVDAIYSVPPAAIDRIDLPGGARRETGDQRVTEAQSVVAWWFVVGNHRRGPPNESRRAISEDLPS